MPRRSPEQRPSRASAALGNPSANPARGSLIGAELLAAGTSFRLWADDHAAASVVVDGHGEFALASEPGGYFSGCVAGVRSGARYRFRLDESSSLLPDLASRGQPDGPDGVSVVCDSTFPWSGSGWHGLVASGQVLHELHLGSFTEEGTWMAAIPFLPRLRALGVTVLQLMPIAEFAGAFG